jgi:transposase
MPRHWRTHRDAFADVWERDVTPLLEQDEEGILEATTVLEELERRYPGRFRPGQVRTLQRRMRDWRALYGPEQEVYFPQVHEPGREAACDFTHATELGVTIGGELLEHRLFELTLPYSGRTWAEVAFGETFEALVSGLQAGLWSFGGTPRVLRLDNMSAATHDLRQGRGRRINRRFQEVLDYYGLEASLITPSRAHENGSAEQRHFRTKKAVKQALLLRGSRDFDTLAQYNGFVEGVLERSCNRKAEERFAQEQPHLRPLPAAPLPNWTLYTPVVRRWSTIRVADQIYSVPSRLMGRRLQVRQYADRLELYYADTLVETVPRTHGRNGHRIDYRHIIGSLVRKPGAFARYRFREDLFPRPHFRLAYDRLCVWHGSRADVEYVRILQLAALTMESRVETSLASLLEAGEVFDYRRVQQLVDPKPAPVPQVRLREPDLGAYDRLLVGAAL